MSSKKKKLKHSSAQLTESTSESVTSNFPASDANLKMLEESKENKRKLSSKDKSNHGHKKTEVNIDSQPNIDNKHSPASKKQKKVCFNVTSTVTEEECNVPKKQKHRTKPKKKKVELKPKDEKLLKKKALKYLKQWKKDRSNWKFEKLRQIWLIQNMFDTKKVPEKKFPLLLDYIMGSKGSARVLILDKAQEVVQTMEQWTEHLNQGLEDTEISSKYPNLQKVSDESYNRARVVLQSLKEEPSV